MVVSVLGAEMGRVSVEHDPVFACAAKTHRKKNILKRMCEVGFLIGDVQETCAGERPGPRAKLGLGREEPFSSAQVDKDQLGAWAGKQTRKSIQELLLGLSVLPSTCTNTSCGSTLQKCLCCQLCLAWQQASTDASDSGRSPALVPLPGEGV